MLGLDLGYGYGRDRKGLSKSRVFGIVVVVVVVAFFHLGSGLFFLDVAAAGLGGDRLVFSWVRRDLIELG